MGLCRTRSDQPSRSEGGLGAPVWLSLWASVLLGCGATSSETQAFEPGAPRCAGDCAELPSDLDDAGVSLAYFPSEHAPVLAQWELAVVDRDNDRIVVFELQRGTVVRLIEASEERDFDAPSVLRVDGEHAYVSSFATGRVDRYRLPGWQPDGIVLQDTALLEEPVEMAFRGGALYVLSHDNDGVIALNSDGRNRMLTRFGDQIMKSAHDFVWAPDGHLYVGKSYVTHGEHMIQKWDAGRRTMVGAFGDARELATANTLTWGNDGLLYVGDAQRGQILRFDVESGSVAAVVYSDKELLRGLRSIDFGPDGFLYAATAHGILRFNARTREVMDVLTLPDGVRRALPRSLLFVPAGTL